LDTTIRILSDLEVQHDAVEREVREHLPFLVTTRILNEAVKNGMGREDAYELIKKLTLIARENFLKHGENNLINLVSKESMPGVTPEFLTTIQTPLPLTQNAIRQTTVVIKEARQVIETFPDSLLYKPAESI
jgi:adenylosuccinate lyase